MPTSTFQDEIIYTLPADNCTDIKEHLWIHERDYTSLFSTMCIFAVIYTTIMTLGILGNLLVILSVFKHRSLQSVRNIFIVSLSCSDIVVCLVSGTITPISAFYKVWFFGEKLCKLVPVIQGTSLCFSTLTLTAISIDRFILIVYPTSRSIQKRHALWMIGFNYFVAMSISFPMYVSQQLVNYEVQDMKFCGQFCTENWDQIGFSRSAYGTIVFLLQFVIPFFIITFCYLMISVRLGKGILIKRGSSEQKLNGPQSEQRRHALKRRLRTNRMLMAMVGVFLCCWTPTVAFNFLRDFDLLPEMIENMAFLFGIITHCISMSSTVWNPVLYALLNEQFRLAFADLIASCRRRSDADSTFSGRISARCSRIMSSAFLPLTMVNGNPAGRSSSSGDFNGSGPASSTSPYKWRYSTVPVVTKPDALTHNLSTSLL
uniref:G_PROTEIN_RECEP_F1_2 domain-containing protein n=1 Tax=Panagrellus redivivus TaxID=6233 RepID=A0A7E4UX64_PANRE